MIVLIKNVGRREFRSAKEELLYMTLRKMGRRTKGRIVNPSLRAIQEAGAKLPNATIARLARSLEERGYLDRSWQIF